MKRKLRKNKAGLIAGILFCLIICVLYFGIAHLQERKTQEYEQLLEQYVPEGGLIYGADDSAPPLRYVDKDGVYKGVVVDYVNQLSLELGIGITTIPLKWEDALDALKTGKTDFCDMFISPERSKYFVFTDPIYTLRTVMVVNEGQEYSVQDIYSMRVATQEGDYANWYMEENFPEAKLVYVHDVGEGLRLLLEGSVDGVIGDEPVISYYTKLLDANDKLSTIGTSLYEEPVCLALPREKEKLLPVLNQAIKSINNKGQLEKIQQKWFGISTPLITTRSNTAAVKFLILAAIGLLCVILLTQINNWVLRKQVSRRTRELEARRNELQLIFDQMPEGILLVNEKGQVINGSYRFFDKRATEKAKEEDLLCPNFLQKLCRNEQCSSLCGKASLREAGITKTIADCIIASTLQSNQSLVKKIQADNAVYEIRSVPSSFSEEKALSQAVLIVVRDITLDEASSQKLLQSSKMIAIGQLAAGMAHQIRNPLGVIRTQSFIIRNSRKEDEQLRKSLDYIDDSVRRASDIIDNVMNFWRVSDDRHTIIHLRDLLESIVLLQEKDFASAGITVEIDCDTKLQLTASEDSLKHILHNLVTNSIDAMEHGGTLTLKGSRVGSRIEITCTDTGCGISKKDQANLFNPFFTTKEPGKGTGLGLFIVYSEVEKIGGSIEVASNEGEGTSFLIQIPDR